MTICIVGLYISRFLLGQVLVVAKHKKTFLSEYNEILKNPKYKVKRSFEE